MEVQNCRAMSVTLPSDLEISMAREYAAPRSLVFEAWTRREHVVRWWGCGPMTMPVCDIDLRVGGSWRYVLLMPDGEEYGFHGVYREIIPSEHLVHTYIYEEFPDCEAVTTVTFEEHEGITRVTETILHPTVEARDGHLQSGMEEGAGESLQRLAELLDTLQDKGIAA